MWHCQDRDVEKVEVTSYNMKMREESIYSGGIAERPPVAYNRVRMERDKIRWRRSSLVWADRRPVGMDTPAISRWTKAMQSL